MQHFDAVIVGAGSVGERIARDLHAQKKQVALVSLPGRPENYFERLMRLLAFGPERFPGALEERPAVKIFSGVCRFESEHTLAVNDEKISGRRFVISTGAVPSIPPIEGLDQSAFKLPVNVITEAPPRSVVVIGDGPVAVGTAGRLLRKNRQVTILGLTDRLLPDEEPEISDLIKKALEEAGAAIKLGARPRQVKRGAGQEASVFYDLDGKRLEATAEEVVVAAGLAPNTKGLELDKAGAYINENGAVVTNEEMRTSAPHVWAAGEVTGPPFLLSLSRHQAGLVSANIFAPFYAKKRLENEPLPRLLAFQPPLASLGLTERKAKENFADVVSASRAPEEGGGLVKIVGRRRGGQLLGASVWGAEAEGVILFFDLILRAGLSLHDLGEPHHYPGLGGGAAVHRCIEDWSKKASRKS